jgi:aspartyl aminopeptidase
MDRMLFDIAAPCLGGLRNDFVFAARLDNLAMCHAATLALNNALPSEAVSLVALFDHEEVGSGSAMGAQSALLPRILERIVLARGGGREALHRALAGSTCISADMAHAVHPNYADRHDPQHRPVLNGGPVLKVHSQQRYATMASTAALFRQLCDAEEVPMQLYAHRSDLPCGSTIGPITATLLGIPTVDVGNPMLSMHSCREVAGSADAERMTRVLTRFLQC